MLRWSSDAEGRAIDIDQIDAPVLDHADALRDFAVAATGVDSDAVDSARQRLVASVGAHVLIDVAAVIANFEMMTRLADGTGARLAASRVAHDAGLAAALDIGAFTSRR